jgi:hypothetical protein
VRHNLKGKRVTVIVSRPDGGMRYAVNLLEASPFVPDSREHVTIACTANIYGEVDAARYVSENYQKIIADDNRLRAFRGEPSNGLEANP